MPSSPHLKQRLGGVTRGFSTKAHANFKYSGHPSCPVAVPVPKPMIHPRQIPRLRVYFVHTLRRHLKSFYYRSNPEVVPIAPALWPPNVVAGSYCPSKSASRQIISLPHLSVSYRLSLDPGPNRQLPPSAVVRFE